MVIRWRGQVLADHTKVSRGQTLATSRRWLRSPLRKLVHYACTLSCFLARAVSASAEQSTGGSELLRSDGISFALHDGDPGVVVEAIRTLARLDFPCGASLFTSSDKDTLDTLLQSPVDDWRSAGTWAAMQIRRSGDSIAGKGCRAPAFELANWAHSRYSELLDHLGDPVPSIRIYAIQALAVRPIKLDVERLVEALTDPDEAVQLVALDALAMTDVPSMDSVGARLLAIAQSQGSGSHVASELLSRWGSRPVFAEMLVERFCSSLIDAENSQLAQVLSSVSLSPAATDRVARVLDHRIPAFRSRAAKILASQGSSGRKYIGKIVGLMQSTGGAMRGEFLDALAQLVPDRTSVLPEIVAQLHKPSPASVRAVGRFGNAAKKCCLDLTIPLLRDPSRELRLSAAKTLYSIDGVEAVEGTDLASLLWGDAEEKLTGLLLLSADQNEQVFLQDAVLGGVLGALADRSPRVRLQAQRTLSSLKDSGLKRFLSRLEEPANLAELAEPEALGRILVNHKRADVAPWFLNSRFPVHWRIAAAAMGSVDLPVDTLIDEFSVGKLRLDGNAPEIDSLIRLGLRRPSAAAVLKLLALAAHQPARSSSAKFAAHLAGGGSKNAELIISAMSAGEPVATDASEAQEVLRWLDTGWDGNTDAVSLGRYEAAFRWRLAAVIEAFCGLAHDDCDVNSWRPRLAVLQEGSSGAAARAATPEEPMSLGWTVPMHMALWLLLVLGYPHSRRVRAIFFWNPWVRRLVGLGYIGFAITWIPWLRRRVLSPFRRVLLQDAPVSLPDGDNYYEELECVCNGVTSRLHDAVSRIPSATVLIGESGSGKSTFVRNAVATAETVSVCLSASECRGGVITTIAARLDGPAKDPTFLKSIVYSGGLNVIIDGLEIADAESRKSIEEFVVHNIHGHILLTAQPSDWVPPGYLKVCTIQPLSVRRMGEFLQSRWRDFAAGSKLNAAEYKMACNRFLSQVKQVQRVGATAAAALLAMVSNPLDLTTVASIIAAGENPDPLRLRRQQHEIVARDFHRRYLREFPMDLFCEHVYQAVVANQRDIYAAEFDLEFRHLEKHKCAVRRHLNGPGASGRVIWEFRHPSVRDFFVARAILREEHKRLTAHVGDVRFNSVYMMIASLLPEPQANALCGIIQKNTKATEGRLSESFLNLLRAREVVSQTLIMQPGAKA
jgi:hypothetical protein